MGKASESCVQNMFIYIYKGYCCRTLSEALPAYVYFFAVKPTLNFLNLADLFKNVSVKLGRLSRMNQSRIVKTFRA